MQDKDMWICLYEGKPTRRGEAWKDDGDCLYKSGFAHDKLSPNWHQTVLSREEYFSAYPAEPDPVADADGWIEWKGGECPVDDGALVDYRMLATPYGYHLTNQAANLAWSGVSEPYCIIAYRPHKPEVKPEFCESVMRSIPEPEAKPTIEQLAADYRNAKDYAERKQQEADAAKADAEAKLATLVEAGKAHGLVVSPITEKQDPELVIADWRDLLLGDIIEYVDGDIKNKIGMTGPVVEFAPDSSNGTHVRLKCDNGVNSGRLGWPKKWRFIRRP